MDLLLAAVPRSPSMRIVLGELIVVGLLGGGALLALAHWRRRRFLEVLERAGRAAGLRETERGHELEELESDDEGEGVPMHPTPSTSTTRTSRGAARGPTRGPAVIEL